MEEEQMSLSIIFRTNTASTRLTAIEEELTISTDPTNTWGCLHLIIPSHNNYEVLVQTLHSLLDFSRTYQTCTGRDVLLLQQHWMEFGKKSMAERIHQTEWITLCSDRLSSPLKRSNVVSLYRKFCNAASIKPEEGITLPKAVGLLDHTRKLALHLDNKVDPCDVVWNILLQYNVKYVSEYEYDEESGSEESTIRVDRQNTSKKRTSSKHETITASAYLKFLINQQKDTKASLQSVKDLFERLNSIALASHITGNGVSAKEGFRNRTFSRKSITKAVFLNYFLSDANDAFDPTRGEFEHDDMSQPLSSY